LERSHPDRSRRRLSSGRASAALLPRAPPSRSLRRAQPVRGAVAQGALSLSEQTVRDVMVPFEKVFMLDEDEAQPPPPPSIGRRSRPIPTGAAAHFAPCVHLLLREEAGTGLQRLDGDVMARIMAKGFSRVPVFSGDTHNIQGRQATWEPTALESPT